MSSSWSTQQKDASITFISQLIGSSVASFSTETTNVGYRGDTVTISLDLTMHEALNTLVEEEITSAPVVNTAGVYMGRWISLATIVKFYVAVFKGCDSPMRFTELYEEMRVDFRAARKRTVRDVLAYEPSPTKQPASLNSALPTTFSLFAGLELLALGGQQQVAIVDPANQRVRGVLVPSMFAGMLNQQREALAPLLSVGVSGVQTSQELMTLAATAQAIDGFAQLAAGSGASAVAICEPDTGVIIDVLTQSDLTILHPNSNNYRFMWENVVKFRAHVRERFPRQQKSAKALTVTGEASLGDVLALMCREAIHNVFVVDSKGVPTGVIGIVDILLHVTAAAETALGRPQPSSAAMADRGLAASPPVAS